MLGAVESAWLFTRSGESVRVLRVVGVDRVMQLVVQGPGSVQERYAVGDEADCATIQAEIERRLVSEGFSLYRFSSERRSGRERRVAKRGQDRRRLEDVSGPDADHSDTA
jgi:hypothetical protein